MERLAAYTEHQVAELAKAGTDTLRAESNRFAGRDYGTAITTRTGA